MANQPLVAPLYDWLLRIGEENRLSIRDLSIETLREGSWGEGLDSDYRRRSYGRYIYRIFNLLAKGHNLTHLSLTFTKASFIAFLNEDTLVNEFSKLKNIKTLEIKCSTSRNSFEEESPKNMLDVPRLETAAKNLISNAQRREFRVQEGSCMTPSYVKRAQALITGMSSLLHHRSALITNREAAAREAEELRLKCKAAEEKVWELGRDIEGLDKDIQNMLPVTSPQD